MGLRRTCEYFFYRSYGFHTWMSGKKDQPAFTAVLSTAVVVYFNALIMFLVVEALVGKRIHIGSQWAVVGFALIAIANYFLFVYGGALERIVENFSTETADQRKRRGVWCWIYVIVTYVVFLASAPLLLPSE